MNLAKCIVEATTDLAIMTKKKHSDKQHAIMFKANKKYFNYGKKDYYVKDYYSSNKKKSKKSVEEAKHT